MKVKSAWVKPASLERVSRNPRRRTTMGGKPTTGPTRPLQEMREALGLTQLQLAEALGMRRSMIANLESDRYSVFVLVGIQMYLLFAKLAAEKKMTALHLEAKRDVAKFIAFQRGLSRRAIREKELAVEKVRQRAGRFEKDLAEAEARLREV